MKVVKIFKLLMLGAMVFGISTGIANAAFITGSMGITGSYTADATTLTLSDPTTGTAGTGDLGDTVTWGTVGTIVNGVIVYDPFTPVVDVLEIGGWHLDWTTLIIDPDSTTAKLKLSGTGLLSGNGFDATPATWTFSANTASAYSMSITAVPVPAAVWLFGSGLIGLAGIARRKA